MDNQGTHADAIGTVGKKADIAIFLAMAALLLAAYAAFYK